MVAIALEAPRAVARAPRYDDAQLLARYHQTRDPRDRELLVQRFLPLALHLSRKYAGAGEREDLDQVASIGLLKALDRYDPSRGVAFSSFAVPTILGELKRYFRDLGWSVRVPRSLQELGQKLDAEIEDFTVRHGRLPTVVELAERCDAPPEQILEARQLRTAHRADSLDQPTGDDADAGSRLQNVAQEEEGFVRSEQRADLDRLLATLSERDRLILRLRFGEDLTQREIAARVGISQMHISRVIRTALDELHRLANDPGPTPRPRRVAPAPIVHRDCPRRGTDPTALERALLT